MGDGARSAAEDRLEHPQIDRGRWPQAKRVGEGDGVENVRFAQGGHHQRGVREVPAQGVQAQPVAQVRGEDAERSFLAARNPKLPGVVRIAPLNGDRKFRKV